MIEKWEPILGYEGKYEVSNLGNVRSLDRVTFTKCGRELPIKGRVLRPNVSNKDSYPRIILYGKNTSYKIYYIHRLVAAAFIPNLKNKPVVNHKDGIRNNNCVDNLEWCTQSENVRHAFATGLNPQIGETSTTRVLNESDVLEICQLIDDGELTYLDIGKKYGVGPVEVHRIHTGDRWNHLTSRKSYAKSNLQVEVVNCRGEKFKTVTQAALAYRTTTSNICKSCKNENKHSGRYSDGSLVKWEYVTKDNQHGFSTI